MGLKHGSKEPSVREQVIKSVLITLVTLRRWQSEEGRRSFLRCGASTQGSIRDFLATLVSHVLTEGMLGFSKEKWYFREGMKTVIIKEISTPKYLYCA